MKSSNKFQIFRDFFRFSNEFCLLQYEGLAPQVQVLGSHTARGTKCRYLLGAQTESHGAKSWQRYRVALTERGVQLGHHDVYNYYLFLNLSMSPLT